MYLRFLRSSAPQKYKRRFQNEFLQEHYSGMLEESGNSKSQASPQDRKRSPFLNTHHSNHKEWLDTNCSRLGFQGDRATVSDLFISVSAVMILYG